MFKSRSLLRIVTAGIVVSFYIYSIISQTRYMSATLFQDYSHYDSPQQLNESPSQQQRQINTDALPKWLSEYFDWHIEMRKKFPGDTILTHPDSPGVLIKACAYKCGGLHDRLGGLGWDLYLANQTRRVFMIHWCIPAPIEYYLVPNLVDWTLPYDPNSSITYDGYAAKDNSNANNNNSSSFAWDDRLFSNTTKSHIHCDRAVGDWPGLFDGYVEYGQGEEFFESHVDIALDRAIHGDYTAQHKKILRYKVLGVDQRLEQRLLELHNESDPIAWSDAFPAMFWTLFKPTKGLQKELDETFLHMKISTPFDYNAPPFYALHARIRHPRGHIGQEILAKVTGNPDKHGLLWDGETKRFAVKIAEHAFQCAQKKHLQKHPLHVQQYVFYADSEDLVTYMGIEHGADGVRVRNMTGVEALHIDRQQGHPPESYYSAFVDLFIASQAS